MDRLSNNKIQTQYDVVVFFLSCFGQPSVWSVTFQHRNIIIFVNSANLNNMLFFAKKSMLFRFAVLSDMWAVDFPARKRRFEINCRLGRYIRRNPNEYDGWLTFKTSVPSNIHPKLFSLSPIFKASAWLEREIWDMFGVYFTYNPELRRILTDYGFEGFPLRKDFPVTGYLALRYDFSRKKTVLEPVDFTFGQEYRYFDFQSPWRFKKSFK